MTNRLADENSPYLLQHAENPVDWHPWGEEALSKARQEDKPIFLSIGYAACHWCHVMAHESFEDPQVAAFMNGHFVNIKVDREERPDLDNIYMSAVVAMTGQGGWPLSVFLTPEGQPFYGGTYFPPARRYGMPSFQDVLASVAHTWQNDRQRLEKAGNEIAKHLQADLDLAGTGEDIDPQVVEKAAMLLGQAYDWKFGGWGSAPKFPQPMAIEFLLQRATAGDNFARDIAVHALSMMSRGGMYDVIGGGFARYSTDNEWLVPHFEKMLYDNCQLALVYLHAYLLTGNEHFHQVCTSTLDFLTREMMDHPETVDSTYGGMYSSLDADSEGVEGKYYVWTRAEVDEAINDSQAAEIFMAAYGVTEEGNFEGAHVLQRVVDDEQLSEQFHLPVAAIQEALQRAGESLFAARQKRIRPGTDDKVLTAWNSLAVQAFAEAARYLERTDYLDVARQIADFLLAELNPGDGGLQRSWRNGKAQHAAYLEDYAGLGFALLNLYQSDPDAYWFRSAVELCNEMLAHFRDPNGGFYDTRDDQAELILRPKDIQDNATPSGNSQAARLLLVLAALTGNGDYQDIAEGMLSSIQPAASRYPTAFGNWLIALNFAIGPVQEVAIVGPEEHPGTQSLVRTLWSAYRPLVVSARSEFPPPDSAPPLLADRPMVNSEPSAYVCRQFTCLRPATTPEGLAEQLEHPVNPVAT